MFRTSTTTRKGVPPNLNYVPLIWRIEHAQENVADLTFDFVTRIRSERTSSANRSRFHRLVGESTTQSSRQSAD